MPIVNDQYGPPHQYGSTIYDVFRPNPNNEKDLLENLYGAGYVGQDVSNVQEQRSPLGQLLQGVGILGQPDARSLTPYEQYMYMRGQRERGSADYQTEEQRQQQLIRALGMGEHYLKATGEAPPQSIMDALPEDMRGMFGAELTEKQKKDQQKQESDQRKQEYDVLRVQRLKQLIGQGEYAGGVMRDAAAEQKHAGLRTKWANMPPVMALRKQYNDLATKISEAADAGDKDQVMVLSSRARDLQRQMMDYYMMFGVRGSGELTPNDAAALAGVEPDTLPPRKEIPSSSHPWTVDEMDKVLGAPGKIGIPQY